MCWVLFSTPKCILKNFLYDIFICDTPESFAKQVLDILQHSKLRQQIGENARNTITDKYSNEVLGKRLLTYYENQLC